MTWTAGRQGEHDPPPAEQYLLRCAAAALLALGVLPVASWIPGGLTDPVYARRWTEWGYGTVICLGAGLITAMVSRTPTAWISWVDSTFARLTAGARAMLQRAPGTADTVIAVLCCVVYLTIAKFVFDAKPLLIDELVQVLQARMYAAGSLFVITDSSREFFSVLHMVDVGDRFYSQFPAGWPAMLAIGSLLNAEWLVGPICGAVAVFVFARLLRRVYADGAPLTVAGGTLLFGLGPFAAFQFSSHMSHGPVVMWILAATLALSHVVSIANMPSRQRSAWGLLAGLSAGCAFAVRPLDAVAYAVPAAVWLLWHGRDDRRVRVATAAAAIGIAVPLFLVMWVNIQTTGAATLFGYEVLWGSSHGLGFHSAPWGDAHTPQRGIEILSLYVTRLNTYLFETPFPSLLLAVAALAVPVRLTSIERLLVVSTGIHGLLYFAYWHDGFYLGPRFVTPWIPIIVLLCLRIGRRIARHDVPVPIRAGVGGALIASLILTATIGIPARVAQYRSGLVSMRADYAAEASRSGAQGALVFVRESWGAQLVARMWALDVSRTAAATLYSGVDACELEHGISGAERAGLNGRAAEDLLRPLLANSHLVRASTVSPDSTERMRPGLVYDDICSARVVEDREGYALFPPFLLDRKSQNIYARSMPGRDSILMLRYPNRRAYLVRRDGVDGTAPLRWVPLER